MLVSEHAKQKTDQPEILVVEDSLASLKLLTDILAEHGYRVRPAADAELALRSMAAQMPDLILLDVKLPGMDGYELCRRLQRDEQGRSIPVIFISAFGETGEKVEGFNAGGVDFITKPFEVKEVLARVRTHLRLRELTERLEQKVREQTEELTTAVLQLRQEITERKRIEEALEEASEKLKFFAYSVAHDLKSPAVGIYGLTKRLHKQYRDVLDDKGRNYCDQIMKASEHIAALVEKINLYITTKEASLVIEKLHFGELIRIARDEFASQLRIRQIEWLEPEHGVELRADRLSLLRVIRNLVDNSLKYGGERLSRICIGYEEVVDFHILSVTDDGKGLKEVDPERIFGLFQRHETSRGIEGAGLGLTIVKEIAEQHGGTVWVKPKTSRETTFCISISKSL
jgi:signal transduction histidine kinase